MNRGDLPTAIVSATRFVCGSTRATELCSVLVTHRASSPNASPYDPLTSEISATTLLVSGSNRASVPFLSIIIQTLPAPVAIEPSVSPMAVGMVAVVALVLRSILARVLSPQFGTHRLPNPTARPEQGCLPLPSSSVATILFVAGSNLDTLSLGLLDTQAASSTASQSGLPPT